MITLNTNFFKPTMECRYFADMTLLNYFGYHFTEEEIFGFSSALYFIYAVYEKNEKSFFSLFGKVTNMLKNIHYLLSGEWYCEYNGNLNDLALLTNQYKIPVIVEINFKDIINFYPNPVVRKTVGDNLAVWDKNHIFNAYPHEMIVVGIDNGNVLCGDHLSGQILKVPEADFCKMWSMPKFEYGNTNKCYYEYIILPQFNPVDFQQIEKELVRISLQKIIFNMRSKLSGEFNIKYAHGLEGLSKFTNDLEMNLGLPFPNREFSLSITKDLDNMYWKGLHRNTFAKFLNSKLALIGDNEVKVTKLNKIIQSYQKLAAKWKEIISFLWNTRENIDSKIIDKAKVDFTKLLEQENQAIDILDEI